MTTELERTQIVHLSDQVSELAMQGKIRAAVVIVIAEDGVEGPPWKVQVAGHTHNGLEVVGVLGTAWSSLSFALVNPNNPTEGI